MQHVSQRDVSGADARVLLGGGRPAARGLPAMVLVPAVPAPYAAMKVKEGAETPIRAGKELSTGSGKVALPVARGPRGGKQMTAEKAELASGVVGQLRENSNKRATIGALDRLNALLDKLSYGDMLNRVPRNPAREFELVLGALNPIELGMVEPLRRFESSVNTIYKQLIKERAYVALTVCTFLLSFVFRSHLSLEPASFVVIFLFSLHLFVKLPGFLIGFIFRSHLS